MKHAVLPQYCLVPDQGTNRRKMRGSLNNHGQTFLLITTAK